MRCRAARLPVLAVLLTVVLTAGCSGNDDTSAPATSTAAGVPSSSSSPRVTVAPEQEQAPPDASFPASIADDSGPAQDGAGGNPDDMHVIGIRLTPQNGYERLVIDLNSSGVPEWTARYTEASGVGGGPVQISGDTFLRLGLFTQARRGDQQPVMIASDSGLVAEAENTGFGDGYEEVLIGLRGGQAPFRAFTLTDPGRIVIDLRPAG